MSDPAAEMETLGFQVGQLWIPPEVVAAAARASEAPSSSAAPPLASSSAQGKAAASEAPAQGEAAASEAPSSSSALLASSSAAAGDLSLIVKWCGSTYTVSVPRTATIADLKRRVSEITSLSTRRQILEYSAIGLVLDDDSVPLLSCSLPFTSCKPILRMVGMGLLEYDRSTLYESHNQVTKWEFDVKDEKQALIDFHGAKTILNKGNYTMGEIVFTCCILKASKDYHITNSSYELMSDIRHPNLVRMEAVYKESGHMRLALSIVSGTLDGFVEKNGVYTLFNCQNGETSFTRFFREIIIKLYKCLEGLVKQKLYPKRMNSKNLYLLMLENGVPDLKVLFHDVVQLPRWCSSRRHDNELWADIRGMIVSFHKTADLPPFDAATNSFCDYIGKAPAYALEHYPDLWDWKRKAAYMLLLMSANRQIVGPQIFRANVTWPLDNQGELPFELQEILKVKTYNIKDPYDFFRICRNCIKHFDLLPDIVQARFTNVEGVVKKFEEWEPRMWCATYEQAGWPA